MKATTSNLTERVRSNLATEAQAFFEVAKRVGVASCELRRVLQVNAECFRALRILEESLGLRPRP